MSEICTSPCYVSVEEAIVIVEAPDGSCLALTAMAAVETGERLIDAGARARGGEIQGYPQPE